MFDGFFDLPSELMSALGTVIGFAMLGQLDYNQQNVLGNFLMLVGQVLETNSTQKQLLASQDQASQMSNMQAQLAALQAQVAQLSAQHGVTRQFPGAVPPPTASR